MVQERILRSKWDQILRRITRRQQAHKNPAEYFRAKYDPTGSNSTFCRKDDTWEKLIQSSN